MNIDQLQIFKAVYHAGNFASVAKARNVAPSSISRSVSKLEASLSVRLFHRTTRSLSPTEEGELFFQRITPFLEEMDHFTDHVAKGKMTPSGRLRMTASVSFGQKAIAPLLASFQRLYPHVQLDLIFSDGQLDLISDRIDLALRHGKLEDSSLTARKLRNVEYFVVASPHYLKSGPAVNAIEDLKNHSLLSFDYREFRNIWLFQNRMDRHEVPIQPSMTMTNAAAMLEAVKNDAGIALLPDWLVDSELEVGRLVRIFETWTVSGTNTENAIWILLPSRRYLPHKTRVMRDFLLKHLSF